MLSLSLKARKKCLIQFKYMFLYVDKHFLMLKKPNLIYKQLIGALNFPVPVGAERLKTPLDILMGCIKLPRIICKFITRDQYIPLINLKIFKTQLNQSIQTIEKNCGHFIEFCQLAGKIYNRDRRLSEEDTVKDWKDWILLSNT